MTYISTQSISSVLRQAVLKMQQQMSDASSEATTGHYADTGLTLGGLSGQTLSLQTEASTLQTISTTNNVVGTRLSTTQTILAGLQTSAQNLLNSLVAANGSNSGASVTQSTATNDLKTLTSSLNTTLGGDYIFGGINTSQQPINDYFASGSPNQAALDTAFSTTFSTTQSGTGVSSISGADMNTFLTSNLPGSFGDMFSDANWSANWSSASDQVQTTSISTSETADTSVSANDTAFKQLAQAFTMMSDLGNSNLNSDAYQAVSNQAQSLLTSGIAGLISIQANVGVTQNNVTDSSNTMSLQMDILTTQVSNLQSVDPYEATTRVQNLQTQIETAYSLTSQLHQLSLVNYL
jgi:flagellar hook-associated protein 3 FlgL